jgi:hypothetical protein
MVWCGALAASRDSCFFLTTRASSGSPANGVKDTSEAVARLQIVSTSIPTYEYRRVRVEQRAGGVRKNLDDTLQELGQEGWALVAVYDGFFYFRRQAGFREIGD